MEPLVSVIVPVYNVFPYLREALDSVIGQTYKKLEIIIVDDGSSDGSGESCDEYSRDPRVQVIHQENKGLSGARNTGLDRATGEYVAFLDSDDAFHPEMIQRLLEIVYKYGADLVACSFSVYETEGCLKEAKQKHKTEFEEEKIYTDREAIIGQMEGAFDEASWNKIYKRSLWDHLRFPEGYVYEDMRVMPLVYEQCERIVVSPLNLVYHRVRKRSITKTHTERNMLDLLEAYRVLQHYTNQAQPPFPMPSKQIMKEKMLSVLAFRWVEWKRQETALDIVLELKEDIIQFAGEKPIFNHMKRKVIWCLFRHCPRMLLPIRDSFHWVRDTSYRIIGKTYGA